MQAHVQGARVRVGRGRGVKSETPCRGKGMDRVQREVEACSAKRIAEIYAIGQVVLGWLLFNKWWPGSRKGLVSLDIYLQRYHE